MEEVLVQSADIQLPGLVSQVSDASGLVIFAHGSGSSRLSPRNQFVARRLNEAGISTLLFDLLTEAESLDRKNVFDIPLLAERLELSFQWARQQEAFQGQPLGLFGASTGAAAALVAAADLGLKVSAVVSRGGRPDMAIPRLKEVTAPTLLLVGGNDFGVIELNQEASVYLRECKMEIVPGATHLFEEPGALEQVCEHAVSWFKRNFQHE